MRSRASVSGLLAAGALAGALVGAGANVGATVDAPLRGRDEAARAQALGFGPCDEPGPGLRPSADLYCMRLVPVPALTGASADLELGREPSPFTIDVTVDGSHRYAPVLTLAGLPEPTALGPYQGFVAWLTTPVLTPETRLGVVSNGTNPLGAIALDKFLVLVTAEPDTSSAERRGRILFRGESPSTRMQPPDVLEFMVGNLEEPGAGGSVGAAPSTGPAAGLTHDHGAPLAPAGGLAWLHPPMPAGLTMLPSEMALTPRVAPWLPRSPVPPEGIPLARPRELIRAADGDTLALEAGFVRRTLGGRELVMYGYNGQHPGPLIEVRERATITVVFRNRIDQPTAIHWHGIRLDNRFDGVPGVTQDPVAPGESFVYRIHFPDPGIYWYHPHQREDVQQDLGLYGNLLVRSRRDDAFGPADREEVLVLDDLLLADEGLVPFGAEAATHALMGRFGNLLLVNGEPAWRGEARAGEVVRFFLTNVSNTRTFNLSFGGAAGRARMKVVGSDVGNYQREAWVESVPIAPAERYVVHVLFEREGPWALESRVRGIDHLFGTFLPEVDTLGIVEVGPAGPAAGAAPAATTASEAFERLREDPRMAEEVERYREHFDRPVDRELVLTMERQGLPFVTETLMAFDSAYFHPVEWSGNMPMMNWASTGQEVRWILREPSSGLENMDVRWRFRVGDVIKLRISNERRAFHAMQHPVHIHGQRFLVLEQNGVPNDNLVWKDTVLVPVGTTVDLLLELSNPGRWMAHCHIAEHLETGMMTVFTVVE